MKKQLPTVIESCHECPYFDDNGYSGLGNKIPDNCRYGKFFFSLKNDKKFPNNCPLQDYNNVYI